MGRNNIRPVPEKYCEYLGGLAKFVCRREIAVKDGRQLVSYRGGSSGKAGEKLAPRVNSHLPVAQSRFQEPNFPGPWYIRAGTFFAD
jgi:hypothetical protein